MQCVSLTDRLLEATPDFCRAIVVTIAATALVPLALNPGQQAADNIFTDTKKQKAARADPLSKKAVAKKR